MPLCDLSDHEEIMRNTTEYQKEEGYHMQMIDEAWQNQSAALGHVRSMGGFSDYIAENPELAQHLTSGHCKTVCCMDERIAPSQDGIAVAGSGILIKDDPEKRQLFIDALKARGVTKLTSHDECGALGIYAKAKGLSIDEAEQHMTDWLKELATELNIAEMKRLPVEFNFHNAVCAYVVLTENFTLKEADGFPSGFQISAPNIDRVVSGEDLLAQVGVAVNIALGEHGFGDRFTEENPFVIVVVANNDDERKQLTGDTGLTNLVEANAGRVVIDSFVLS